MPCRIGWGRSTRRSIVVSCIDGLWQIVGARGTIPASAARSRVGFRVVGSHHDFQVTDEGPARRYHAGGREHMDSTTNTTNAVARPIQRVRVYAIVALVAFLIGLVPMWLSNRTRTRERDEAQQALRLARIENGLAASAIRASRGEYEPARQAASSFFTGLRTELDRTPSAFSDTHRQSLEALLGPRDQVITWLARSDPAGAAHLSNAYVQYRKAFGE